MYRIVITEAAARQLKKLGVSRVQKRLLIKAIDSIASDPFRGYALRKELKGFYKLRVGDYRIVYEVRRQTVTVVIIGVGHRKGIYEALSRRTKMI